MKGPTLSEPRPRSPSMLSIPCPPETVKAVENYLHLGWSVIPVCAPAQGGCKHHESCKSPGKRSLVEWGKYQRKAPTTRQVRAWFEKWPDANVAVLTGTTSGIAVLDVDANDAEVGPMQLTPRSLTGRGQHNFFELKRNLRSQHLSESLEMKADGKYVVLPNSIHPSGSEYLWAISPFELDGKLADIPDWLERQLRENPRVSHERRPLAEIVKGVAEGERNTQATRLCGKLIGALPPRDWESIAWPLLVAWSKQNEEKSHPFTDSELRTVFDKITKREVEKALRLEKATELLKRIEDALSQQRVVSERELRRKLHADRHGRLFDLLLYHQKTKSLHPHIPLYRGMHQPQNDEFASNSSMQSACRTDGDTLRKGVD